MEKYNYKEAVKDDVKQYIEEEIDYQDYESIEELKDYLNYTLQYDGGVTRNCSDSYTCNAWQAEEYLCHNLDLLAEALEQAGQGLTVLHEGAESCDVIIRSYVLGEAIEQAVNELGIEEMIEPAEISI